MTIEIALLVTGGVLAILIWQLHRGARLMSRQLNEIQSEVNALRDVLSRVFLARLNNKEVDRSQAKSINGSGRSMIKQSDPPDEPPDVTPPPPSDPTTKNDRRENDVPQQHEMEFEVGEINELCAKLITLVPPNEAAPLLLPDRVPSGVRERRVVPRHQTSKVGKIILHLGTSGDICTVSNMSPAGALLLVANAYDLAEQFDLQMDGYIRRCIARWRRLDRVGVKFRSVAAA
jgi:hypothetical protein